MQISRRTQENIMAIGLLLVFVGFLVVGMSYSPKARLVPVPLAVVSIALILLQLVLQNLKSDFKLNVDTMELFARQGGEGEEAEQKRESTGRKELAAVGLVFLVVGMIVALGMMPAMFLFIFGYFILVGKERWLKSLIYSIVTVGVLYLLFTSILGVPSYEGWLGSVLGPVL